MGQGHPTRTDRGRPGLELGDAALAVPVALTHGSRRGLKGAGAPPPPFAGQIDCNGKTWHGIGTGLRTAEEIRRELQLLAVVNSLPFQVPPSQPGDPEDHACLFNSFGGVFIALHPPLHALTEHYMTTHPM